MHRPAILGIAAVIALAVGYTLTAQNNEAPKAAGASGASCCPSMAAPAVAEKPAACPMTAAKAGGCGEKCDAMLASMDETLKQIETAKGSNDTKQMAVALDAAGKQLTTAKTHIAACLAAKKADSAPAQKAEAASCCPSSKTTAVAAE